MSTATLKTSNFSGTDATSYTTGSITPVANRLLFVCAMSRMAIGSNPNIPTATGNGITWDLVTSQLCNSATSDYRLTLLSGSSASPSTGTITIDFNGQTQLDGWWTVVEVTTNARNPGVVVQTKTGNINNTSTAGISVNYDNTFQTGSFAFATVGHNGTTGVGTDPQAGWTELAEQIGIGTTEEQWFDGSETNASATRTANVTAWTIIAVEVGSYFDPPVGTLTLSGVAPTVSVSGGGDTSITPTVGSLTVSGVAGSTLQNRFITPTVGSLTASGVAGSTLQNRFITPTVGSLTISGVAGSASQSRFITPLVGTLTVTGIAPTVQVGGPVTITPLVGTLTVTGIAPTVSVPVTITPLVGTLTFTGIAPTAGGSVSITPVVGALTFTGIAPTVTAGASASITPVVGVLVLTGQFPFTAGFKAGRARQTTNVLVPHGGFS